MSFREREGERNFLCCFTRLKWTFAGLDIHREGLYSVKCGLWGSGPGVCMVVPGAL